jgi:hypothetical protein
MVHTVVYVVAGLIFAVVMNHEKLYFKECTYIVGNDGFFVLTSSSRKCVQRFGYFCDSDPGK